MSTAAKVMVARMAHRKQGRRRLDSWRMQLVFAGSVTNAWVRLVEILR